MSNATRATAIQHSAVPSLDALEPLVELTGIGKAFPGEDLETQALKDIHLRILPGEWLAAGQLVTCLTYRESSGERGVQVQGRGQLQGNGTALYDVVRFRVLESGPGPWHEQPRGKGSRLPSPMAFLAGAAHGQVRVLWLRREGLCCPSAASAWVSDVGERANDGPRHVSGFGQPCD